MPAAVLRRRKRPVDTNWRPGATYIKVGGERKYVYRAVLARRSTFRFGAPRPRCNCAHVLTAGIETMHMIRTGRLDRSEAQALSAASRFRSPAF